MSSIQCSRQYQHSCDRVEGLIGDCYIDAVAVLGNVELPMMAISQEIRARDLTRYKVEMKSSAWPFEQMNVDLVCGGGRSPLPARKRCSLGSPDRFSSPSQEGVFRSLVGQHLPNG